MSYRTWVVASGGLLAVFVLAGGCGSEDDSSFGDGADSGNGTSGASGTGISSGASGDGGSGNTSGDLGDGAACNAASARAVRPPLTMIMGLDQSCSMGDCGGGQEKDKRWVPVTTALKGFWGDPVTVGISADLRLFPNGGSDDYCKFSEYDTPVVPMTPLPNVDAFAAVLVDNPQKTATPTRAVLRAMAKEADALVAADATAKLAVVLVTDGQPQFCDDNDNDIDNVKGEIANKPYPTYVIAIKGTGDSTLQANADAIAAAGQTQQAFLVDTDDPGATQQAFTTAMDQIRGALVPSCELTIPPPPQGKTFDKNKVNVTITSGATQTPLGYDPACAGAGWKYDDPNAPTAIVLCPQSCDPFKADANAQLDVAFGCTTRAAEVN